jgi:hypothetical protein
MTDSLAPRNLTRAWKQPKRKSKREYRSTMFAKIVPHRSSRPLKHLRRPSGPQRQTSSRYRAQPMVDAFKTFRLAGGSCSTLRNATRTTPQSARPRTFGGRRDGADLRDRFSVAFGHSFHKYVRREPLKADVRLLALNCGPAKEFHS